jgi:hypothetical protein
MRLGERDLRMMSRLVRAQARRMEPTHTGGGQGTVLEMPLAEPLAAAGIQLPIAAAL